MADQNNSIINLSDLTRPGTVLIEKISDAVGILFEPTAIVRRAQAEAKAERIRALSRIEIGEIERRALDRFVREETRAQENMEAITANAVGQLSESASPEDISPDWISEFFERCRRISDADLQTVWANLLAGEAEAPGRYSKRSINTLAQFERAEALALESIAAATIYVANVPAPYVRREFVNGPNYEALHALQDLNVIELSSEGNFVWHLQGGTQLRYFNDHLQVGVDPADDHSIDWGCVAIKTVGKELLTLCRPEPIPGFFSDFMARCAPVPVSVVRV